MKRNGMMICAGVVAAGAALFSKLLLKGGRRHHRRIAAASPTTFVPAPTPADDTSGIQLNLNLNPSEILKQADDIIALSKKVHDKVASVPLDEVTYENVIAPLANLEAEQFPRIQECIFPRLVAGPKEIHAASAEAERRIEVHNVRCSFREDVYVAVKAFADKAQPLGSEAARYLERLVRDFERLGVHLSKEIRDELEILSVGVREQSLLFQQHLHEENSMLYFTATDLEGLPSDYIKDLRKRNDGTLEVSLKYHHYLPIMERCKVGATRRAVANAYNQKCVEQNTPILEKLVALRHSVAQLLGYENHAEYATANRMARNPQKVKEFLESVSSKMSGLARMELKKLKALKKEEEGDQEFGIADLRYYICKAEEAELKIDFDKVKHYFPVEVVTKGVLKIYQDLLDLRFKRIHEPRVWHAEVQLFAVFDAESGERVGHFYLDLHPRDGKCSHACVCSLQSGCIGENGTRKLPVAALLANFPRPTTTTPSLLTHAEVVTYVHEFGHVMHHVCSRVSFIRFTGLRTEDDFVEAPSQMMENWCFESSALTLLSGYYKDTKVFLPADVCQALSKKRRSFAAILAKRQLLFALFDQAVHSTRMVDTTALSKKLHFEVMEGIQPTEGNLGASFSHLASGYDAAYYGYLWSEVFSADMFASKFKWDIFSKTVGKEYREKILKPGASKDGIELLEDFLGRTPTEDAFLRSKAIREKKFYLCMRTHVLLNVVVEEILDKLARNPSKYGFRRAYHFFTLSKTECNSTSAAALRCISQDAKERRAEVFRSNCYYIGRPQMADGGLHTYGFR